jgi:hypothetical protein
MRCPIAANTKSVAASMSSSRPSACCSFGSIGVKRFRSVWFRSRRRAGEAGQIGGLSVQLVYYREISECRASRWVSQSKQLTGLMERIDCRGGPTQIGKVLKHALRETGLLKVQALVFVGDAMEEEPDGLLCDAATLGRAGVPAFMFQEGRDKAARLVFEDIARLYPRHLRRIRRRLGRQAPRL